MSSWAAPSDRITLSCSCGGTIHAESSNAVSMQAYIADFDANHRDCRTEPDVDLTAEPENATQ